MGKGGSPAGVITVEEEPPTLDEMQDYLDSMGASDFEILEEVPEDELMDPDYDPMEHLSDDDNDDDEGSPLR